MPDEEWITTKKAAEIAGLSIRQIQYLLATGKIDGQKLGEKIWVTTREAVQNYLATKPHPGRKPQASI